MRLQQRQARETGICPVRRELYSQCFGELSKLVTLIIKYIEFTLKCRLKLHQICYEC